MKRLFVWLVVCMLALLPVVPVLADSWEYNLPIYTEWVSIHYPNNTGYYAGWVGSYVSIDEDWKNYNNEDFMSTSTENATASFQFTNWFGEATIDRVIVVVRAKKIYEADDVELLYREDGINYSQGVLSPSSIFDEVNKAFATNPATEMSWNTTSVTNMEWCIRKTGNVGTVYVSQMYVKAVPGTINGATSLSEIGLIAPLNVQNLVYGGYINSNALNTDLNNSDAYSPAESQLPFFLDAINAYDTRVNNFRLSYSPNRTDFNFVAGIGGNVTFSDDPSIELGDGFSVELSGYINVNYDINKNLIYKQNAFRTYISANETVTSAILGAGDSEIVSVNITGLSTGLNVIETVADGDYLRMYVNDTSEASTALNGANVTDNLNDWIIMQNDSIKYLDYAKISIGYETFHNLDDSVTLTVPLLSQWVTIDVASYVPIGATGAIIHCFDPVDTPAFNVGFRSVNSTDNMYFDMGSDGHTWLIVKLDNDRRFQVWLEYSGQQIYLTGYTTYGVSMSVNSYNITPSLDISGWQTVNLSAQCPNATGVVIQGGKQGGGTNYGVRMYGSADDRYDSYSTLGWMITGCDSNQTIDVYRNQTRTEYYVVGYVFQGATFHMNAYYKEPPVIGEWGLMDCSSEAPNADTIIFDVYGPAWYDKNWGLRKYGSGLITSQYAGVYGHQLGIISCDEYQRVEGRREATSVDFFIVGYAPHRPLKLWYQPNTIISGNTLPDRATSNDGVIAWGTNPCGITIWVGALEIVDTYTNPTEDTEAAPGMWTPLPESGAGMVPGNPAAEEIAKGLPFYYLFNQAAVAMGMPTSVMYMIIIIAMAIGIGFLFYVLTGSVLVGIGTVAAGVGGGISMGLIPLWYLIVYLIISISLVYVSNRI